MHIQHSPFTTSIAAISFTVTCYIETRDLEFSESHTAVNNQEELTDILGDWGLSNKGLQV